MLNSDYLLRQVSVYKKAKDTTGYDKPYKVQDIIKSIKSEKYKERTAKLRTITDPEENSRYKTSQFIGVTLSGIFMPPRSTATLFKHSGLICLDIDKLAPERLKQVMEWLKVDVHTFICFISPNGNGIKVIVKIDIGERPELHNAFFEELERYYKDCYEIAIDKSGKNVDRLCFLPYDPNIFVNPESKIFCLTEPISKEVIQPGPIYVQAEDIEVFNWCLEEQNKKQTFLKGNRNHYITCLANFCNDYGVSKETVLNECINRFVEQDFTEKEIRSTINSVYRKTSQHGIKTYEKLAPRTVIPALKDEVDLEVAEQASLPTQTPTIPVTIYNDLPPILKVGCNAFTTDRERDVFLTGALTVLSGCFPSITGIYDGTAVSANLYSFIVAPAASGKGAMVWAKQLGISYHKELVESSKDQQEAYEPNTESPPTRMLFFPANSSGASVILNLKNNSGKGIIFESEADTLSSTLSQDWGNYSDMLRKAFHHEAITYSRKTNKEFYEVEHPQLSVCLSGTPAQVKRLIPTAEDGLFSRFMFYYFSVEPLWRDVSPNGGRINLNEYFSDLEKEVYEIVKNIIHTPIVFKLQNHHWDILNQTFAKWLNEVSLFLSENAMSTIKRLGLITFRIAMILSVIRQSEEGITCGFITCTDVDFNTAMQLADVYKQHAVIMFRNMPEENSKPTNKFAKKIEQMEKAITLKEQGLSNRAIATEIGVSDKTIGEWLKMRSA